MPNRTADAGQTVRYYSKWAAGAGLIPIPVADLAAITGVQVKMFAALAKTYDVPYNRHKLKGLVGGLLGSVSAYSLSYGLGGSFLKMIPLVGSVLGFVSTPIFAGAVTYGLGTALIAHFESGGTLENLDPASDSFKRAYQEGYSQGREEVATAAPSTSKAARTATA